MADLAACYFCGDALDDGLAERPVVPAALRESDPGGPTVTLCPSCAEKLTRVTDAIVAAATDRAPTPPSTDSTVGASEDAERPPAEETDPDAPSTAADDDASPVDRPVVEGEHGFSALEYNKVMRLLENREFPVDREEIVTVAASAYQLSRADCDRVIDVAIDRGLIGEAEGQLVRPE